ncbi:hypothetical protein N7533_010897 [Penicillium manginii]|uniref:uncharacterized protein n=1 Tax=Penicillium manginii TaxID=203109 RepID=UPI002546D76F|nr:uncharacterized protein N7533_010897 [Penicillium manginii]KAJ5741488.1 hypothetical protein N7533_010897 [Penicillium manginii]
MAEDRKREQERASKEGRNLARQFVSSSTLNKHKYLLDSFLFLQGGQTILKWDWVGSILKEEAQKSHAPSVLAQDDQFTG